MTSRRNLHWPSDRQSKPRSITWHSVSRKLHRGSEAEVMIYNYSPPLSSSPGGIPRGFKTQETECGLWTTDASKGPVSTRMRGKAKQVQQITITGVAHRQKRGCCRFGVLLWAPDPGGWGPSRTVVSTWKWFSTQISRVARYGLIELGRPGCAKTKIPGDILGRSAGKVDGGFDG